MSRILAFFVAAALLATSALAKEAAELWTNGVQSLFDQHCVKCHGPLEQKNGLELDTIEAALEGSEDGPVIVPGKPDESLLFEALRRGSDPHMPPKKQLTDNEIEKVRAWIAGLARLNETAPRGGDDREPVAAAPADPSVAIDHFLALGWKARAVEPAPLCDDRTFLRRVYLDLAGRIPTRQEADAFLFDASPEKRAQLVDRLLASDDYPRTFREIWDVLLMGRGAGRRDRRREENGWFDFLERAFKENRPWDEVVRAIITARPELPSDKGALWFVYERRNEHQRIAEAIAPVIYGTKLDCAQCHDHPLAREIKQGHYWGLVAAFNRSKNSEKGSPAVAESAIGGFINFTNLKKESQPAMLAMLTGRTIEEERPASGAKENDPAEGYIDPAAPVRIPRFSRRAALAEAATRDNPLLARAFVNYTWAILLGRGFVHPVDEMNSKNKPSHPELLDWLASDFAKNNFDVRRLVRAIVLSRGYQLGAPGTSTAPPAEAFAAALEKPLLAETLARSARIASGRTLDDAELRKAFAEKFPEVMPRTIRATIQQAMFLAHNETLAGLFKPDPNTAVSRLGELDAIPDRAREAFRLALIREPDAEELARAVEFLQSPPEPPAARVGELLWTLVTGPEFLTNH